MSREGMRKSFAGLRPENLPIGEVRRWMKRYRGRMTVNAAFWIRMPKMPTLLTELEFG